MPRSRYIFKVHTVGSSDKCGVRDTRVKDETPSFRSEHQKDGVANN